MAISSAICTSFKQEILVGTHNFTATSGDTFKIALYTSSASLDASTTAYTTSNEVSGTGYSAKGNTLTRVDPTTSGTTAFTDFADLSFETIAGAGANAAIVHYSNPSAEKILTDGEFLLVDSGIQCGGGTTDATRTMVWGEPDAEQQRCYTRVLQAHIRLARQVFPEGTNGAVLDGVTRSLLWNEGLDFGHGTGHGVGAFLGVHEGPQRISAFAGDVGFRSGMIISNEPGYYRTGWGGIRLENLYVVQPAAQHPRHPDGKEWLCFDTLTLIPFERKLVCEELLTEDEWKWLQRYHKRVWEEISPLLNEDGEKEYLWQACDWSQQLQAAA